MTVPSKTWVRRRLPSTTWKWTFTRSPAWKAGTLRSWARSRLSMTPLMAKEGRAGTAARARTRNGSEGGRRRGRAGAISRRSPAALAALLEPPLADPGVVAREEDVGTSWPRQSAGRV